MTRHVLMAGLSAVAIMLAAALFFVSFALVRVRRQMAAEIGETSSREQNLHPQRVYRRYADSHPQSLLNRAYVFLSVSTWLLAISIGVIGYCFGRANAL